MIELVNKFFTIFKQIDREQNFLEIYYESQLKAVSTLWAGKVTVEVLAGKQPPPQQKTAPFEEQFTNFMDELQLYVDQQVIFSLLLPRSSFPFSYICPLSIASTLH